MTTSSVTIEFQAANGTTSYYQVEFGMYQSVQTYNTGRRITGQLGQTVYRFTESNLIPGRSYVFRITPYVRSYPGIPSNTVTVTIMKPGMMHNYDVVYS